MVDVYSVQTSLTLNDQLLNGLRRVAAQLRLVDTQVRQLQGRLSGLVLPPGLIGQVNALRTGVSAIGMSARQARTAMSSMRVNPAAQAGVSNLSRNLGVAEARALALSRTLATMHAVPAVPSMGSGGGRGGGTAAAAAAAGGRRAGGGLYGRFHQGPVGAHVGVGLGEAAGLGLAGASFMGMRGAAAQQLALQFTLQHANIPLNSPEGRRQYKELLQISEEASRGTIFSNVATSKMMPTAVAMSMLPLNQAKPLMLPAIRFAEYMQLMGTSIGKNFPAQENMTAALRFAHLANVWDPVQLERAMDQIAPLSLAMGQSPTALENTMKYSLPAGRAMGMTAVGAAQLTALTSILGLSGTTAGTGVAQMLIGLLPHGGVGAALGARTPKHEKERRQILRDMGVIDDKGKSTLVRGGEFDMAQLLTKLQDYRAKHPGPEGFQALNTLMNVRGGRAGALLSGEGVMERLAQLVERMKDFQGARAGQTELAQNSVWQQVEQVGANLYSILVQLNQSLSGTTHLLQGVNSQLSTFRKFLSDHPRTASAIGDAAMGLGAYGLYRFARRLLGGGGHGGGGGLGGVAAGGAAGAAGGFTVGRAAKFLGRLRFLGPLGALMIGEHLADVGTGGVRDEFEDAHQGINAWLAKTFGPSRFWPAALAPGAGIGAGVGLRRPFRDAMVSPLGQSYSDILNAPLPMPGVFNMAPSIPGGPRGFNPLAAWEKTTPGQGPQFDFMREGKETIKETIGNVSLTGETTLTGQLIVNMGTLGTMIQDFIHKGITHAMGGESTSTARPDNAFKPPPT